MAKFNQGNLSLADGKTVDGADVDRLANKANVEFEQIAETYIRTNQSFSQMFYDDFINTDKTNGSYTSKVDTTAMKMTPGNAGEWRSVTWTASSAVTACKLNWKAIDSIDHDIRISADSGSNWTTISTAGAETNKDKEVVIANSGTSIILQVYNGTVGSLENYVLLVK